MSLKKFLLLVLFAGFFAYQAEAQCGGQIMEPGFAFLSSSRGCAPFTVQIETLYLSSTPGTQYYVNWGDGSPEETYIQTNATGVVITHSYPNSPVTCGYDVVIDADNACNPIGSVVPITTQVVVWTNDIISMDPGVFRVCQGYATDVLFTDNSDWNCYPRATRENNEARWIQWIYGTGPAANQIPGIQVNSVLPGAFPYLNPAPLTNPIYPVLSPGQVSLPINVPATTPADIGKEFVLTLKNWNQCNPYDNVLTDGNPRNPTNGDLVNGDNAPQLVTGRIVIVDSPVPNFLTRLGGAGGPVQTVFCVGDDIYFDNETPSINGASFSYLWQFYNNSTGTGPPITTSFSMNPTHSFTSTGDKLIRLTVHDDNAAGNCEAVYEFVVTISPSLVAQIRTTDLSNNVITPDFCQESSAPLTNFSVRFADISVGTILPSTRWRWEFYNPANVLIREEPAAGAYSATPLGPFDQVFTDLGVYRVVLRIRDQLTSCESIEEIQVRVFEKPQPAFTFNRACEGSATTFTDASILDSPIAGEQIVQWEWDMSYDGVTFNSDPAYDGETTFDHTFGTPGSHTVALRVTTDGGGCSAIASQTIVVDPLPVAAMTPDRTSGCSTLEINFTNNSVLGQPALVKEFIWEINDGSGFVVDSIQHPSDPGFTNIFTRDFENTTTGNIDYQYRLRVVSVNDCERISAPVTITVFPGPISGFVSLNYSPFGDNCSPVSVDFSVDAQTQALNPSDYQWTIADEGTIVDQISTGTTPSFTYVFTNSSQSVKDFDVTLRAVLASACYGDSTRTIRINPVPSSAFTIDTLMFDCERMQFHFDATQKGLDEYSWAITVNGLPLFSSTTVGDNFDYEVPSAAVAQNLAITLVTTNLVNCESSPTTRNVTVPQYNNMNASFTATPLIQTLPGSTVTITNTTNAGPWTYEWDFGDNTTSTSANPGNHTYATYGTYTISLTVTDGICTESQQITVQINPIPPVLDFSYDPPSGCAPLTVQFTNLSQFADETTYFWNFGENEGSSRAVNPSYTYYEPGIYSVSLSATNVTGDTSRITKQFIIEVFDRPEALFNVKPRLIYIPGGKLSTNNQSFGASSYVWDFGDGTTSTEVEPTHEYTQEGIYTIVLEASNAHGCVDTARLVAGVRVDQGGQLLIPNAFSPSLSGPGGSVQGNDVFIPLMRGVTEFKMQVFDRWGEMLFETMSADLGWDGYYKGKLCQQDVYVYKITVKYANGDLVTKVGDIHLIR
jgi:gliding motility-associated-like protein